MFIIRLGFIFALFIAFIYSVSWSFNHINPWLSIIYAFIVVVLVLQYLYNKIKSKF